MALTGYKIKIWSRLIAVGLAVLAALCFVLSNREPVSVKFLWMESPRIPMYAFIVIAGAGGVLLFWVCRGIRRLIGEARALWREEKSRRQLSAGSK